MPDRFPLQILIVEDDLDACDNLKDILELDEHHVSIAHTAAQALACPELKQCSAILLDWKLPDMTALDFLPRLRAAVPDADVVIITGFGEFDKAVSALRQGVADYLLKPINAEFLRASLRRLAHRQWLSKERTRQEAMVQNLVRVAPCFIAIVSPDLKITYISPFAEKLTGYSSDEVLGGNFADIFLPQQPQNDVADVVAQILEQKSITGREIAIRCRNGTEKWLIWNAQTITDADGQLAILAVGQDVSEHKRAVEQLVQSERLAAIGEAMTGLAHESRNALQRSQAFLELLAAEVEDRPDALKLVSRLQEAQKHLHQLYEEVREYAAPLRLEAQDYAIDELVLETWVHLEQLRNGRDAQLSISPGYCSRRCHVDQFMMQQVFRNILENSLAATPDPVRIRCECHHLIDGEGDWLQVCIRDNGPGLNPDQRQRIFDPFYTTKTRGTGLGMTLCRRIVEAHGGKISTGAGPGTEIIIRLPRDRMVSEPTEHAKAYPVRK